MTLYNLVVGNVSEKYTASLFRFLMGAVCCSETFVTAYQSRINYRIIVDTVHCDSICRCLLHLHVSVS
jgi:hypothetical protein